MKTIVEVSPVNRGRFCIRLRREDSRGNVQATSSVTTGRTRVQQIARQALAVWLALDDDDMRRAR